MCDIIAGMVIIAMVAGIIYIVTVPKEEE